MAHIPRFLRIKDLKDKGARRAAAMSLFALALAAVLLAVPTGYEGAEQFRDAEKCRAKILETDNSRIFDTGLIRSGQQICRVKFLSGKFKGHEAEGWNMLGGSLSQDKIFYPGDVAQCVVHWVPLDVYNSDDFYAAGDAELAGDAALVSVNLIDHFRLHGELLLALAFAVFLVAFAGRAGFRAFISFALTVLLLWKVLIPLNLRGADPILTGLLVTSVITLVVLALVLGWDRRLLAAAGGAMSGVLLAALLAVVCTKAFQIHGAVMPGSESLLYAGYSTLNLTRIFMASVFVGASGSIVDLAVDISCAVGEVVKNSPGISRWRAVKSGCVVARSAMATMTTTLLLAYSGSCVALLMTFMAQGTPLYNILNNNQVAAEIINVIAGSFGLASTAPFTALLSGVILTSAKKKSGEG